MNKKYVIDEILVDKYGITDNLERVVSFTTEEELIESIDNYAVDDDYAELKDVLRCAHTETTLDEFIEAYGNEFKNMSTEDIGSVYVDYILDKITDVEVVEPPIQ